jgi:hypothetical protein
MLDPTLATDSGCMTRKSLHNLAVIAPPLSLRADAGLRENPIMGAMAKSLDDAQIRDLSCYFSDQRDLTEKY